MVGKIKNINLAVTNKCNTHCKHCDIWQEKPKEDISLELVNNFLNSEILDKNLDITLTGGEPFLHKNFMNLIELVFKKSPYSLKTISTNGALKEPLLRFLNKFHNKLSKDFSLHISLDGINSHDKQRSKSLKKVLGTIDSVKENFPYINIKLKFAITPINYNDIIPTFEYAHSRGLDFKAKLVEYAKNYTNKINKKRFHFNKEMKKIVVGNLLFIYKNRQRVNKREADFMRNTIEFLLGKNKRRICRTPFNRIFVMPDGKVYSCIHFKSIGDLNDNDLDRIWKSKNAELIRNKVRIEGCNRCVSYHGFNPY